MTFYKTKAEIEKMKKTIVDFATDMTEWDLYEYNHPYDELVVL